MPNANQLIIKNAAAMFVAQAITWAMALLLTIFAPRYLGPHEFGIFTIAFSVWSIAGVLAMWGIDTYLIKSIARQPARAGALLKTALLLRTGLFLVIAALVGLYVWRQHYPAEVLPMLGIMGVITWLNSYASMLGAGLHGLEMMRQTSLVLILHKGLHTIVGIAVLALGLGVYGLGWVMVAASFVSVCGHLYFCWGQRANFTEQSGVGWLEMLKASSPYLMSIMVLTAYGRIDVLIMAPLVGPTVVGWYSVAMTLVGTMLFVPTILSSAIFPSTARSHTAGGEQLGRLMGRQFDLTLLVIVPMGMGLMVISEPLILLLYGPDFAPAAHILAIMGAVLIFMSQNVVMGQFLNSIDRQNRWTVLMVAGVVVTIILDLQAIPWAQQRFGNGALGAALSFVATEGLMFAGGLLLLPKGLLGWANARTAGCVLLAGLVMVLACWWVRHLFIAIPIVVGVATYSAAVLLLPIISPEDRAVIKGYLARAGSRLRGRFRAAVSRTSP